MIMIMIKTCKSLVYVYAGAQCCIELRNFSEAIRWCDEGLKAHPFDKKLQELRAAANKHKVRSPLSSTDFELKALYGGCIVLLAVICIVLTLISLMHKALFVFLFLRGQQREMPGGPQPKKKSCMVRKKLFWLL